MNLSIRKSKFAFLIGLSIAVAGCTDLEEEPFGQLAASDFGSNDGEFTALLAGGYTQVYGLLGNHNSLWSMQEISSDEAVIPTRGADWADGGQWIRMHKHEMLPSEESVNNAWNKLYTGIATANRLLETLPALNPERAAAAAPELRGLRALYYYYLLDTYGNVPLITTFLGNEAAPATRPRAEIYDFVVSELTSIIPDLPNQRLYARMTRPVAQALLAKVYLNAEVYSGTSQYEEAVAQADSVINSGFYSIEDDYFANFVSQNEGSRENIFVIPYDERFGPGFNLGQMTLHYQNQLTFQSQESPWNGYASLQEFYDSYDDSDLRKGQNGNATVPGNFIAGQQFTATGDTLSDPAAESTDPDGARLVFTPELNQLAPGAFRQAGVRLGKFRFPSGFTQNLSNDFPILRYSDILLTKAEGLYRLNGGGDGDAIALVNLVRERAGIDGLDELDDENLLAERGREMFLEMTRRQDLIRFGKFGEPWYEKPASDETKELMPIPAAQIQANPNLVQNPGY